MCEPAWRRVRLADHPRYLDQVAIWHHRECLRQGLQSRQQTRRERLLKHLNHLTSVPQTWLALKPSSAELIGCVSVVSYHLGAQPGTPQADTPLWLSNLYVAPEWRQQGVASGLITGVKQFARELSMPELWLTATDQSDFYSRRGWRLVRQAKLGGRWVSVMSHSLVDAP
ncbi:GNAT family N-acetyltransferase [Gilvimarinus polysaccharolyticus]|uniref:GNAT family N-acetyltransferase n=1 Tax=Gilvimarinus polysaccharolyticus TaxID=863921 RepID=UPI00067342CE|nr:GNAT family N-acetyltransferase [Gilvimarinus polysaccharolyticus]